MNGEEPKEPPSFVKNAADPRQVKVGGRKEREKRQKELDELRSILQNLAGRAFVWRFLTACEAFSTTPPSDPIGMAWRDGRRDVGLKLLADVMDADPEMIGRMAKEARTEETEA